MCPVPDVTCATLFALGHLSTLARSSGPDGLQILPSDAPGKLLGHSKKKIFFWSIPGQTHRGEQPWAAVLRPHPVLLPRGTSDTPRGAASPCSSLGSLDWSHAVIPVTSCERNIKSCQTDLAEAAQLSPSCCRGAQAGAGSCGCSSQGELSCEAALLTCTSNVMLSPLISRAGVEIKSSRAVKELQTGRTRGEVGNSHIFHGWDCLGVSPWMIYGQTQEQPAVVTRPNFVSPDV